MSKKKRVRLYDNEAEFLGIEPKEHEEYRSTARYYISKKELKAVKENFTRVKLNHKIATSLGLKPQNTHTYALNKEQYKKYSELDIAPIKRLFFDIETSPMIVYSWRTGYKLNIPTDNIIEDWKVMCISYKWENEDKVYHLTWDKNKCDKQMLIDFVKIMNEADECIAHNGDRFDIKKIRTRCIYHRIPMLPKYRTLDTLKKSRSSFVFDSNRLDYIAKYLKVGSKLEHDGFDMWVSCMKGDKKAMKKMLEYCDRDVVVLEDVYLAIQNYITNNTHAGVHNGKLKASCPNCSSEDVNLYKTNLTAKGTIKRLMECNTCDYHYEISNRDWRNFIEMKSNNII